MKKLPIIQVPFFDENDPNFNQVEEQVTKPSNFEQIEQELIAQLQGKKIDVEREQLKQFLMAKLNPEYTKMQMDRNAQVSQSMGQADRSAKLAAAAQLASDKAFTTQQGILSGHLPNSRDVASQIEGMSASNQMAVGSDLNNKLENQQIELAKALGKDQLGGISETRKAIIDQQNKGLKFQAKSKFMAESKDDRAQMADIDSIGRFLSTGNPVLQSNAQFRIARMANGTGVLTQQDFDYAAKGDPSLGNYIRTTWGKYVMGEKISPRDVQLLSEAVPSLKQSVRSRLEGKLRDYNHIYGDLGFSGDDLYRFEESELPQKAEPTPTNKAYEKLNPNKTTQPTQKSNGMKGVSFDDFLKGKR